MDIPKSYYVYEFAYPEEMPEVAGIIFYVGKGTSLSRMDIHLREAAREDCSCAKCKAIQSIWAVGLVVVRNIVFTSSDEMAALSEEKRRIVLHRSPYLTNIVGQVREKKIVSAELANDIEPDKNPAPSVDLISLRRRLTDYWQMPISKRFQQPGYLDNYWLWEQYYPFYEGREGRILEPADRLYVFCTLIENSECNGDWNSIRVVRLWYHKKCQEMGIEPDKYFSISWNSGH